MKLFASFLALALSLGLSAQSFENYNVNINGPNGNLAPCLDGFTLFYDYNQTSYAEPLIHGGTVSLPTAIAPPTTSNMRVNTNSLTYYSSYWSNGNNPMVICCECEAYMVNIFVDQMMQEIWISLVRHPELACDGPGCNNTGD